MKEQKIYLNATATFGAETDVKALIADAASRRRMSRLIKMGVATGLQCLRNAGLETPDAIITASGYGFLEDSEKLLRQMVTTGEQGTSPTPFMQSTFNTIGSHLAIISQCRGYNMTYSHREDSLSMALADALMLLSEGCRNVLVVTADELTPTLDAILTRMGTRRRGLTPTEGAAALLLSTTPTANTLGELTEVEMTTHHTGRREVECPTADALQLAKDPQAYCGKFISFKIRKTT